MPRPHPANQMASGAEGSQPINSLKHEPGQDHMAYGLYRKTVHILLVRRPDGDVED